MPFKDGRMTPAEKRAMSKRYGVEEGNYLRESTNYTNKPDPSTYKERLIKASQNDYDTRKTQEFMNAALKDDELRESLGKKAQKFLDDYKGGDKKDSGLIGISNFKELAAINDFGRLYHKHEKGGGGQFSSFNDYGGNTEHMGNALRKHYDRNFVTQDELPKPEETTPDEVAENEEITLSPEHQQAKDRLDDYKNSIISGSLTDSIYGKESNATKPQNLADTSSGEVSAKNDTSDINVDAFASKAKQASSTFLNEYKKKLTSNFVPEIY